MIDQGAVQIEENHIRHKMIMSWCLSLTPEGGASGAESVALTIGSGADSVSGDEELRGIIRA